jgi:hypothetical protein
MVKKMPCRLVLYVGDECQGLQRRSVQPCNDIVQQRSGIAPALMPFIDRQPG